MYRLFWDRSTGIFTITDDQEWLHSGFKLLEEGTKELCKQKRDAMLVAGKSFDIWRDDNDGKLYIVEGNEWEAPIYTNEYTFIRSFPNKVSAEQFIETA
jgi:hypothetical protein